MNLGYSTNAFVRFSLQDALKKIAHLGFQGVEIMCDRPHLYPPDFNKEETAEIKALITGLGLAVTNLNSFTLFAVGDTYLPSWIESDRKRRDIRITHTLQSLRVADSLGCANISVPPGGPLGSASRKGAFHLFHQGLEKVLPLAEELQVKVLVEPEPNLLIENSREAGSFIRDVGSPYLGVNFDVGHFYCVGEEPAVAFENLFAWVGHVHVEDIASTRVHHHLIPGRGTVDFPDVFRTMARLGYGGDVTLELYPYVDNPEQAGREGLKYLQPILSEAWSS